MTSNEKENVNAPQILLLFPELTEFLLDGKSAPLEAIALLDKYVADKKLDETDFDTHYKLVGGMCQKRRGKHNDHHMQTQH